MKVKNRRGAIIPIIAVIVVLHVIGFGTVFGFIIPKDLKIGATTFGLGLALTAYVFGLRHAFDPDHIAAIDNTTRTLSTNGRRPRSVGMWFSLGHSTIVFLMALLIAVGSHYASTLVNGDSALHQTLGIIGTSVSGFFLILLGVINVIALAGIWKAFRAMRSGEHDEKALDEILEKRGIYARILAPAMRRVVKPWQVYFIGLLFGLGFDTATEIALLVLAGSGAASGIPWYAILILPILFAAGMCLMDSLDGIFMATAYDWAFARPARKIFYNMVVTGLSVVIALLIGVIEVAQVLHDNAGINAPILNQLAQFQIDQMGFVIVGLFVLTWIAAILIWKFGHMETRWETIPASTPVKAKQESIRD
ncbi:Nickel transporter NicT [Devriesea agamarum]|uniref:HoxN/HupN/NixA family nickel/cobalt transporter n=1 Tax=Devriesea agamarum TaxID=472569 RepID=UPI000AD3931A|nr:HoxN/HupN/NixA family nickel/cobalt transporter [Devriesea agamarum]